MITMFRIPFPPSANAIWRNARGRTYLSKEYKTFLEEVAAAWRPEQAAGGWETDARYTVTIQLFPATRRKYDVDNRIKPTLDALTKAGVWLDDEQVDDVRAVKMFSKDGDVWKGGFAFVIIESNRPRWSFFRKKRR